MSKKITQNVNKDKLFNDLPKVRPQMSAWKTKHANYQSCNLGQIVPIYFDEVLPGEKREIKLGMISHLTTPVAPIFNSIYTEIRTFFVPHRLSADLLNGYRDRKSPWVKVFGEDNVSGDASVIVPLDEQKLPDVNSYFINSMTFFCDNVENHDNVFDSLDCMTDDADYNYLSLAAYELIYQRHYRNENYESSTYSELYQLLFDAYNREADESDSYISEEFTFEFANREKDYFTGAKPFTQKGDAPIVSVGGTAPLKAVEEFTSLGDEVPTFKDADNGTFELGISGHNFVDNGVDLVKSNLVADLSTAKGISIEELRVLIKTQELLEKDAMYGSMYAESLNAHFGTCPLDLTLQDPQELFKTTISTQMQAIFQTSTTTGEASILGTIGANSTTQAETLVLPMTEFKEHGLIMICAVHKLQNVYDSSKWKPRFNLKKARFDFYTPELNDLGYQKILKKETPFLSNVPGFNEAFAEYRYKFNKRHGSLNQSFVYWSPAISNEYGTFSGLYKENPEILDEALSIPSLTAPQFYDAWGFEETNVKPMSLHSIPGMDGVI